MTRTRTTISSTLDNIVVVLDHPQNVVNIAGVIRVMKNFGLGGSAW